MGNLYQDIRYGSRMLVKNPSFTIVTVLTLALAIGGNVAVFSLLDAVLLRPLPYVQPQRLFMLFPVDGKSGRAMVASSYPDFQDWQKQSHAFETMAAYESDTFNLTGTSEPERLRGLRSTPGLFRLLGIRPELGREFGAADDARVVLLSYELWQRRFAGDREVIGRPIHLDGWAYNVVGVLPPRFFFPPFRWEGAPEVFVPLIPNPDRGWNYVRVVGRLAPGSTERQAQSEMKSIAARLAQAYPATDAGRDIALGRLSEVAVSDVRQTAWVLLGAVAFVLLIGCANVANLLLSRAVERDYEIRIRASVGATRARIVRQLLTENVLLAGLGGALGMALAECALPLVAAALPVHTSFFTRVRDSGIHLDIAVLGFAATISALSVILFGLIPAWRATKPLKGPVAGPQSGRTRGALIAVELALSFILLSGAGLMVKSLVRLLAVNVGFRTEGLLTLDLNMAGQKYSTGESQTAYFGQVLERLESLPSVRAAGAITDLPMTRSSTWNGFEIPGTPARQGVAGYHSVSPNYFRAMRIPLLSGREFQASDSAHSPRVAIVNRSLAKKYWPNRSPVGLSLVTSTVAVTGNTKETNVEVKNQEVQIVGVVGDVRQLGLDAPPGPELFLPYTQWTSNEMSLVLRTDSEPSLLVPAVNKEIWRVDPDQPVTDVRTMDELVATEAASRRFVLQLIGAFALMALALAAVGIYGVVSQWARQRTREIGIRMALGARPRQIAWLVVRQNSKWLLGGIAVGVAGAVEATRLLARYLYAVRPTDSTTFVAVGFLLAAVALLASLLPARRATKVDPMTALRYE